MTSPDEHAYCDALEKANLEADKGDFGHLLHAMQTLLERLGAA